MVVDENRVFGQGPAATADKLGKSRYSKRLREGVPMQLIAPDILAEARGLSYPFTSSASFLGAAAGYSGGAWHASGSSSDHRWRPDCGLRQQQALGRECWRPGCCWPVSAGLMGARPVRFVAFSTSGLGFWLVVHAVVPTFQEAAHCFLSAECWVAAVIAGSGCCCRHGSASF